MNIFSGVSNVVRGLGHAGASAFRGNWGEVGNGLKRAGGGALHAMNLADTAMDFLNDTGVIDSKAADRQAKTMNKGIDTANANMESGLAPVYENIQSAQDTRRYDENGNLIGGRDRSWGTLLDDYDSYSDATRQGAFNTMDRNREQANAAMGEGNIQNFMNPYADRMANKAGQAVAGKAGAALQSSATNRDIADAVADKYESAWKEATNTANQDFANKFGANKFDMAGLQQNLNAKNNQMSWDMQPTETYNDLKGTETTQRYNADVAKATGAAEAAGKPRTLLSWVGL